MRRALLLAEEAGGRGEVPVGCVITRTGEIVGEGSNRREEGLAAGHAEMEAITAANRRLGAWRLSDCELYVTLEPCPMCAGACLNYRIGAVAFGAYDARCGAVGSAIDLLNGLYGREIPAIGGIMRCECADLLTGFFKEKR